MIRQRDASGTIKFEQTQSGVGFASKLELTACAQQNTSRLRENSILAKHSQRCLVTSNGLTYATLSPHKCR